MRRMSESIHASMTCLTGLGLLFALSVGCEVREVHEAEFLIPEDFSCAAALDGWKRASAVTPDVVAPCMTGSSGSCEDSDYRYVSGTGWCRPIGF